MPRARQRAWIPWAVVGFLFSLCAFLAFLQNRWLDEVSRAEKQRFHEELQDELELIRHDFESQIANAVTSMTPSVDQILEMGAENAANYRFARKNNPNRVYFRNSTVVETAGYIPEGDVETNRGDPALIEVPIPGSPDRLFLELDLDYLRRVTFPALLARYLDSVTKMRYEAEVVSGADRGTTIFQTNQEMNFSKRPPDGLVGLLDFHHILLRQRLYVARPGPPPGRWRLMVRYEQGAMDAIVARARWQNAGISAGLLALILATGAVLVTLSRRAQQLAELQFNFVTGVSHELRTPITVIRTAAFNLRGKLAKQAGQVELYGQIIQEESEKLSTLVEQVLAFASSRAGRVIQAREPVALNQLVERIVSSSRGLKDAGVTLTTYFDPALPLILADPLAVRNAVNNLLDNALKYGLGDTNKIDVSVLTIGVPNGKAVEVRVTDHGPGIPAEERDQLFEPFFRCRRAIEDQVHGTGLGLSLVRSITDAHGGSAYVESEPGRGTTVVLRFPASIEKHQNELANSTS